MAEKAGIEIRADMSAFRKELQAAREGLREFNAEALKVATGVANVESASNKASKGLSNLGSSASRVLDVGLGMIGARSVEAVVMKMVDFGRESISLAINLQAVENRARAVFGTEFPQARTEFENLGKAAGRSASDITEFATGFANLLDSVGVSGGKLLDYSKQLTSLTITLGKAFPDKSDAEVYSIIEAGILGNTRGLRQLGIVMKDDQLQRFATSKGIKLLLKDMDEEQKVRLRTMFLLEQTTSLQDAAAKATGQLGDATKSTQAAWKDMLEAFGQSISPFITKANEAFVGMMSDWMKILGSFRMTWFNIMQDIKASSSGAKTKSVNGVDVIDYSGPRLQGANMPTFAANKSKVSTEAGVAGADTEKDLWKKKPGVGGGGKDPEKEHQKLLDDIKKAEDDILKSMGEQAKVNKDRLDQRRKELLQLKDMGMLTAAESKELDALNRRVEFQGDKIDDATKAWEEQRDAVKDVNKEIEDINGKIADEAQQLQNALTDIAHDGQQRREEISRDAGRSIEEKAADMMRELKGLDDKLSRGEGNSADEQQKRKDIEAALQTITPEQRKAGQDQSTLNPFDEIRRGEEQQLADSKADQSRREHEAEEESQKRLQPLIDEMNKAEENKQTIVKLEVDKKQAVIDALNERATATAAAYQKIQLDTKAHVDAEIAEFNRLSASARVPAVPAVRRASGGPVFGPGGPTSDSIPAWLSNGEYVINAAATRAYRPLIERINAMAMPRFAAGGPVSNHSEKTVHFTMHNHGDAARAFTDPRMAAWLTRTSF